MQAADDRRYTRQCHVEDVILSRADLQFRQLRGVCLLEGGLCTVGGLAGGTALFGGHAPELGDSTRELTLAAKIPNTPIFQVARGSDRGKVGKRGALYRQYLLRQDHGMLRFLAAFAVGGPRT
jgi:hypothetical protein